LWTLNPLSTLNPLNPFNFSKKNHNPPKIQIFDYQATANHQKLNYVKIAKTQAKCLHSCNICIIFALGNRKTTGRLLEIANKTDNEQTRGDAGKLETGRE
jgi:hypothetical protein